MNGSAPARRRGPTRREWAILGGVLLGLFGAIQLVPAEGAGSNPPVTGEPVWDSPRTRELFARACADCHSNQVRWPWYSRVAPVSWLVASDVREAREHLNVSEWDRPQKDADEAGEEVRDGAMPLRSYLAVHPEARLTEAEREALAAGLEATFGGRERRDGRDRGRGGEGPGRAPQP
jgi:mono/diheme cytochrome c family protein